VVPNEEERSLVKGDIRVIDTSLQFVNELLRNMLDLHRTSKGHGIKLHLVPTDVAKDVLEPVASILYMRGASVKIITECNPPNLYVMTDRMRLKQILLNLSFNATKFVEKGYIRLRADVVGKERKVTLYVEDSGPGIPLCKRNALFTKFQDSLDVLNQGTGIGLALCKQLSLLMGRYHPAMDGVCKKLNPRSFVVCRIVLLPVLLHTDATLALDDDFDSGIPDCPGTCFTLQLKESPLALDQTNNPEFLSPDHYTSDDNVRDQSMVFSGRDGIGDVLPSSLSVL
jgi:hypothetical protein